MARAHGKSLAGRHRVVERDACFKPETPHLFLVFRQIITGAHHDGSQFAPGCLGCGCKRINEKIGTLEVAHHADVKKIGGICRRWYRFEFGGPQAIVDDNRILWLADFLCKCLPLIFGDEQQAVCQFRQHAFDQEEDSPRKHVVYRSAGCRHAVNRDGLRET